MEFLLNLEYNTWKLITKEFVASAVKAGSIDKDAYKRIVGEDYVAPEPTNPASSTTTTTPSN